MRDGEREDLERGEGGGPRALGSPEAPRLPQVPETGCPLPDVVQSAWLPGEPYSAGPRRLPRSRAAGSGRWPGLPGGGAEGRVGWRAGGGETGVRPGVRQRCPFPDGFQGSWALSNLCPGGSGG